MGNIKVDKLEKGAVAHVKIPPICYFPPMWETIINSRIKPAELEKFVEVLSTPDPIPPKIMAEYMGIRIELIKNLVNNEKLDPKIGKMAISHLKSHIKALE